MDINGLIKVNKQAISARFFPIRTSSTHPRSHKLIIRDTNELWINWYCTRHVVNSRLCPSSLYNPYKGHPWTLWGYFQLIFLDREQIKVSFITILSVQRQFLVFTNHFNLFKTIWTIKVMFGTDILLNHV